MEVIENKRGKPLIVSLDTEDIECVIDSIDCLINRIACSDNIYDMRELKVACLIQSCLKTEIPFS